MNQIDALRGLIAMDSQLFNDDLRKLVDAWCNRRELVALSTLLPSWLGNFGHRDQWEHLAQALRHTYAMSTNLPADERDQLKRLWVDLDSALRSPPTT